MQPSLCGHSCSSCFTPRGTQVVALVGSSGCGKSTVASLLLRFYDPMTGRIYLDNTDLRQFNVNSLRRSMGLVSQEPVLFNTSIYENIAYGRDGVAQCHVEAAARAANAHQFIKELPNGYSTSAGEAGI